MAVSSKRVENLLSDARVAIKNALEHDEIKEKIISFGYNDERLQKADDLCSRAEAKYQEQQKKQGEQLIASKNLNERLLKERDQYIDYRQLARKNFKGIKNYALRKTLGIDGIARKNLNGVLKEARQLYEGIMANEAVMEKMSKFAITQERLQEWLAGLDELKRLDEVQEAKKGAAQQATKEREDIYEELQLWLAEFTLACRSALKDDAQQLEKMGIVAPSEGYKKRSKKKGEKGEQEEQEETEETGETGDSEAGEPS